MAVIKADAYGHGLLRAAEALQTADGFAMLELDAAVRLREAGYRQRILLLEGFFSIEELALIEQYQLSIVIHNHEQLSMLCAYNSLAGLTDIFLKVNTGMNRLGFTPDHVRVLETLRGSHAVGDITLMTHFSRADEMESAKVWRGSLNASGGVAAGRHFPVRWPIPLRFYATRKHMPIGYGPVSCCMAGPPGWDERSRAGFTSGDDDIQQGHRCASAQARRWNRLWPYFSR